MQKSRNIFASVLAVTLLSSWVAAAEVKLGYVDLQRALLEVDEGRDAKARLQKALEGKQKELDGQQEALRKEKESLEKQAPMMAEDVRNQKQGDLQRKLMELAQKYEKGKAEMAQKERTELESIFKKMDPIIAEVAQRESLTMVFEKTDSGIVFAPASLDITNELVRMYNAKNKAAGGAKKADAAPKKK